MAKQAAPAKRPNGRPPYEPTQRDRATVEAMTAYGIPQDEIAATLKIAGKTLRRAFREEIDRAAARANSRIATALFNKAVSGDVIAQIFWLKCRARWTERVMVLDAAESELDVSSMSDEEIEARIAKLRRRTVATRRSTTTGQ